LSWASCPSLQHTPHPCNTQSWLSRLSSGCMPWPFSQEPHRSPALPTPSTVPKPGHSTAAPSTFSVQHPQFLTAPPPFCSLHSGSFLSPHIWDKSAPPPSRPCLVVPRAQAGRDSCSPNSWGWGGGPWELERGGFLVPTETPPAQCSCCLAEGGREGGRHSSLGFLDAWLTPPHLPSPPHSSPLPGRKPVCKWRSLHPTALPGGCLPVSVWHSAISGPCVGRESSSSASIADALHRFLHVCGLGNLSCFPFGNPAWLRTGLSSLSGLDSNPTVSC
jgi:hypothetical protein